MKTFVSKAKLSKKAKKEMNQKARVQWAFKPVSRVIPNKKKKSQEKYHPENENTDGISLSKHGCF